MKRKMFCLISSAGHFLASYQMGSGSILARKALFANAPIKSREAASSLAQWRGNIAPTQTNA